MRFLKVIGALLLLFCISSLSCSLCRQATKGNVNIKASAQDNLAEILKYGGEVIYEDERNPNSLPVSERLYRRVRPLGLPVPPRMAWTVAFSCQPEVTDDVIQSLEHLDTVEVVFLDRVPITDHAIRHLCAMKKLKKLILSDIPVSDAGLERLAKCATLEYLSIANSEVTGAGVLAFRNLRPEVEIVVLNNDSY